MSSNRSARSRLSFVASIFAVLGLVSSSVHAQTTEGAGTATGNSTTTVKKVGTRGKKTSKRRAESARGASPTEPASLEPATMDSETAPSPSPASNAAGSTGSIGTSGGM